MYIEQLRNNFEADNAKNLSKEDLVSSFVPTDNFYRLLSKKNQIVIGNRGSGKTALAKMLSHSHLSGLAKRGSQRAEAAIFQDKLIGVYVSTKAEWVGNLINRPSRTNNHDKATLFVWKLNISLCKAFLTTVKSCLDTYIARKPKRLVLENEISRALVDDWFDRDISYKDKVKSLQQVKRLLEDSESEHNRQLTRQRVVGDTNTQTPNSYLFRDGLSKPLKRGLQLVTRRFDALRNATWLLCLDEAEFLEEEHHKILNTHIRGGDDSIVFKITTTPYSHYTRDTHVGDPVRPGHDFDYVYIGSKRRPDQEQEFTNVLYNHISGRENNRDIFSLQKLLGSSVLLESKSSKWTLDSHEMDVLKKHASDAYIQKAKELYHKDEVRFRNEVVRKVHGLLKLREATNMAVGHSNLEIYSGEKMLSRCGDDNPRRIIRLIKMMLLQTDSDDIDNNPILPKSVQTEIFIRFADQQLQFTKNEPGFEKSLFRFLEHIGEYMQQKFHKEPLTGDVVSSFEINSDIADETWELIKRGVGWGFLFPVVNRKHPSLIPIREGRFHIANVLAPRFRLLPRRGRSLKLSTIMHGKPDGKHSSFDQPSLWHNDDD